MGDYVFHVFVERGDGARIADQLRAICRDRLGVDVQVEVVDVSRDPQAAERFNVVATPTVVRSSPAPERRVLGRLDDVGAVVTALGLEGGER